MRNKSECEISTARSNTTRPASVRPPDHQTCNAAKVVGTVDLLREASKKTIGYIAPTLRATGKQRRES